MQALRHCKFDRTRLENELAYLASCGFNYIRVLSMVDWPGKEISPVSHLNANGSIIDAWPDYDNQLIQLITIAYEHGLRTQLTLFADAQYIMPSMQSRQEHLQRILKILENHAAKIILYEIANEAWQNGFPDREGVAMLQLLGKEMAQQSHTLLALSSPPDAGSRMDALNALYVNSPATIATLHFTRDLHTNEGPWLPVIDCWRFSRQPGIPPISNNEPIGPGASVASETDPERIFSAVAFSYLAGLPMYVFHSAAGVNAEQSFTDMPWLCQMKSLLAILPHDLPNWERFDANAPGAPLTPVDQSLNPCYNCGAHKDGAFIVLPLALNNKQRIFHVNTNADIVIYTLMPPHMVQQTTIQKGSFFTLESPTQACLITGRIQP